MVEETEGDTEVDAESLIEKDYCVVKTEDLSDEEADHLKQETGVDSSEIEVINNNADIEEMVDLKSSKVAEEISNKENSETTEKIVAEGDDINMVVDE